MSDFQHMKLTGNNPTQKIHKHLRDQYWQVLPACHKRWWSCLTYKNIWAPNFLQTKIRLLGMFLHTPPKRHIFNTHLRSCQWEGWRKKKFPEQQWTRDPHKLAELGPESAAIASHYSLFWIEIFIVIILSLFYPRLVECVCVLGGMRGRSGWMSGVRILVFLIRRSLNNMEPHVDILDYKILIFEFDVMISWYTWDLEMNVKVYLCQEKDLTG